MNEIAERLFGTPPAVAADTPASRLYATPTPDAPRVDPDPAQRIYAGTAYATELHDGAIEGADMPAWRETATALEARQARHRIKP